MDRGEGLRSGGTEEENHSTASEKNSNQKTIIDTIMLKYRPIAPKPVGGSPATSADSKSSVAGLTKRKRKYVRVANRRSTAAGTAPGKDKVKDQKGKDPAAAMSAAPDPDPAQQPGTISNSVAEVRSGSDGSEQKKQLLLYEFLPEISTHQKSVGISARNSTISHDSSSSLPTDDSQILTRVGTAVVAAEDDEARGSTSGGGDMGVSTGSISVLSDLSTGEMMKRKKRQRQGKEAVVVQSWVTVERLTDACMDTAVGAAGLGNTDFERKKNLEQDTCPGFISDALNQVPWTNLAYRNMVIGPKIKDHRHRHRRDQLHHCLQLPVDLEEEQEHDDDDDDDDVVVLLVEKESLPIIYPAFACLVRLQYYNHITCCTTMDHHRKDNKCCLTTMTVPCDVWRMDRGGFAWRLDVKAALTL